jgi:hypothetical protein
MAFQRGPFSLRENLRRPIVPRAGVVPGYFFTKADWRSVGSKPIGTEPVRA